MEMCQDVKQTVPPGISLRNSWTLICLCMDRDMGQGQREALGRLQACVAAGGCRALPLGARGLK